jgi:hypothetical protein
VGLCRTELLDNVIDTAVRSQLNGWLTNAGYALIPADWTYRQTITAIYQLCNATGKFEDNDIVEA